ncbi:MAG: FAD-dependent oxidoreductase [Elusimicrobia bacterium]|nr:FAD-dependent oxidoreductase [Elusimicrobiota bacterium]
MNKKKHCFVAAFVFFFVSVSPGAAEVPSQTEVVIIGAGLSGLSAAYQLKKAGVAYRILEAAPRVGGRVRTVTYQIPGKPDIYVDSGMEEYWASNPAVRYLKELGLPVDHGPAASSLILEGKLYALADETSLEFQKKILTADEFKALEKFKAKVTPWVRQLEKGKASAELLKFKEDSFADFVTKEKLPSKVAEWIRVSVECESGTEWDNISALDGLAEFHIFLGEGEEYYRVQGGNQKFTDALAGVIGWENISLNKRVTSVVTKGTIVTVHYLDGQTNENGSVEASRVISTIPLFRLPQLQFDPPLSEEKLAAIESLGWGAYFKAHIFVKPGAKKFWTVNGQSILPVLSDSKLGVIYDGNPQDEEPKILSLLIQGKYAETFGLPIFPADRARQEIKETFEELWPGFSKEIERIEFYNYHPRAIAAWPPGRSRFDQKSEAIRKPENRVYLAGDFTESSHSDGAFISAERAVRQILEERKKTER